jgi:hypothetical protein
MNKVKETFFITKDEADALKLKHTIDHTQPHFILENGTKMYCFFGWVGESPSNWYDCDEPTKL